MSASRVSPMWLPGRQKQYFGFHFGKSNSSKLKGFLTNMIKILRKWRSEWGSLAAKIAPRDAKCLFATVGNFCESCINGPLFSILWISLCILVASAAKATLFLLWSAVYYYGVRVLLLGERCLYNSYTKFFPSAILPWISNWVSQKFTLNRQCHFC